MATPNAARHRDLEQRFKDLEQQVARNTTALLTRPQYIQPRGINVDNENAPLTPGSGAKVASGSVTVPDGFAAGFVLMFVSCGATWTDGEFNITVWPALWNQTVYGPAINSGNSTVSVANSFWAYNFSGVGAGTEYPSIDLEAWAICPSGSVVDGNANAHLAAAVIFTR